MGPLHLTAWIFFLISLSVSKGDNLCPQENSFCPFCVNDADEGEICPCSMSTDCRFLEDFLFETHNRLRNIEYLLGQQKFNSGGKEPQLGDIKYTPINRDYNSSSTQNEIYKTTPGKSSSNELGYSFNPDTYPDLRDNAFMKPWYPGPPYGYQEKGPFVKNDSITVRNQTNNMIDTKNKLEDCACNCNCAGDSFLSLIEGLSIIESLFEDDSKEFDSEENQNSAEYEDSDESADYEDYSDETNDSNDSSESNSSYFSFIEDLIDFDDAIFDSNEDEFDDSDDNKSSFSDEVKDCNCTTFGSGEYGLSKNMSSGNTTSSAAMTSAANTTNTTSTTRTSTTHIISTTNKTNTTYMTGSTNSTNSTVSENPKGENSASDKENISYFFQKIGGLIELDENTEIHNSYNQYSFADNTTKEVNSTETSGISDVPSNSSIDKNNTTSQTTTAEVSQEAAWSKYGYLPTNFADRPGHTDHHTNKGLHKLNHNHSQRGSSEDNSQGGGEKSGRPKKKPCPKPSSVSTNVTHEQTVHNGTVSNKTEDVSTSSEEKDRVIVHESNKNTTITEVIITSNTTYTNETKEEKMSFNEYSSLEDNSDYKTEKNVSSNEMNSYKDDPVTTSKNFTKCNCANNSTLEEVSMSSNQTGNCSSGVCNSSCVSEDSCDNDTTRVKSISQNQHPIDETTNIIRNILLNSISSDCYPTIPTSALPHVHSKLGPYVYSDNANGLHHLLFSEMGFNNDGHPLQYENRVSTVYGTTNLDLQELLSTMLNSTCMKPYIQNLLPYIINGGDGFHAVNSKTENIQYIYEPLDRSKENESGEERKCENDLYFDFDESIRLKNGKLIKLKQLIEILLTTKNKSENILTVPYLFSRPLEDYRHVVDNFPSSLAKDAFVYTASGLIIPYLEYLEIIRMCGLDDKPKSDFLMEINGKPVDCVLIAKIIATHNQKEESAIIMPDKTMVPYSIYSNYIDGLPDDDKDSIRIVSPYLKSPIGYQLFQEIVDTCLDSDEEFQKDRTVRLWNTGTKLAMETFFAVVKSSKRLEDIVVSLPNNNTVPYFTFVAAIEELSTEYKEDCITQLPNTNVTVPFLAFYEIIGYYARPVGIKQRERFVIEEVVLPPDVPLFPITKAPICESCLTCSLNNTPPNNFVCDRCNMKDS